MRSPRQMPELLCSQLRWLLTLTCQARAENSKRRRPGSSMWPIAQRNAFIEAKRFHERLRSTTERKCCYYRNKNAKKMADILLSGSLVCVHPWTHSHPGVPRFYGAPRGLLSLSSMRALEEVPVPLMSPVSTIPRFRRTGQELKKAVFAL
jgi:hypothetical protein